MTLQEWLKAFGDLDAYMAGGGQLLDLPLTPMDELPPASVTAIYEQLSPDRLDRLGRFLSEVGAVTQGANMVGYTLTENQVRAIWAATAHRARPA